MMSQTAYVIVGIVSSSTITAVFAGVFHLIDKHHDRKAQQRRREAELKAKQNDCDDIVKKGIRLILHDRIKHIGSKYITERQVAIEDLRDLIDMHKFYHDDLGGNGLLDYLMTEVKKLSPRPGKRVD